MCVDKEILQPSILLGGTYFYPPVKLEACRLVSRHSGFAHKVNNISSGPIMCQMWTSPSILQMRKMSSERLSNLSEVTEQVNGQRERELGKNQCSSPSALLPLR